MKKILVTLLVLALCTPAMAATIAGSDNGDLSATVTISADGAANLVGLGLDVDVDAGAVTAVSVDTANFDINPDAGYTLGAGYTYGAGTPVADKLVPGQISLPQSSFALSFGNLNGSGNPGADGAASVQVTITVSVPCNLTVGENATRGGIVAVDGESLVAAPAVIAIGPPVPTDCIDPAAATHADWVSFGKPDCWCFQRQCKGDADGLFQGTAKTGFRAVDTADLTILATAWQIKEPPDGPGVLSVANGICADFDHAAQGTAKTGFRRVDTGDLTILATNWQIKEPPDGAGVPVCPLSPASDIAFYTN